MVLAVLLLLLLLLDRKVSIVMADAASASAVLTSCIAVLMIGPQGGGVVVVRVKLFRRLGLGGGTAHRRARSGRSQGRVAGPRSRQSRIRRATRGRSQRPLLIDPRRDRRQAVLGVVLRVPRKFCLLWQLLLLLMLLRREWLIGDAGRGCRVGGRVGARRG